MMSDEAFLYNWYDKKLDMDYLGYHKGNPEDGYVCSHIKPTDDSPWMLEEYKKRPEDFTRIILAHGTAKQCRKWEEIILTHFDAARNSEWYNKHNGGMNFVGGSWSDERKKEWGAAQKGKQIPEATRLKMKLAHQNPCEEKRQKLRAAWKIRKLTPVRQETREKLRESHKRENLLLETRRKLSVAAKGENNPMFGKQHTKDSIMKMSEVKKGKYVGENNPMFGKHHSELSIKKMSIAKMGENNPMRKKRRKKI